MRNLLPIFLIISFKKSAIINVTNIVSKLYCQNYFRFGLVTFVFEYNALLLDLRCM